VHVFFQSEMKHRTTTVKKRPDRLGYQTYDQFFISTSPTTTIQFWGLVVLGGSLIAAGLSLLFMVLSKFSGAPFGTFEGLVLLFVLGICASFVYLGVVHLKRAFVGRR
jgi:hypothetical protein